MAARTRDMTRGNPTKLILSFCLPIIAGNLFQQFYSLVDTLVIGRVEGVTALAAVSAAGWLDWTVLGLAMGMAQGFSIQIAQFFGAGDYAELRRAAGQSILLSAAITVVLTLLSELLLWPMLTALRSPENTIGLTCQYLRVIFGGVVFVMSFNLLSGFLRSLGDSRTPLYFLAFSTTFNVILDIFFVSKLNMGISGVAWATLIAQGISSLLAVVTLVRRLSRIHTTEKPKRFDRHLLGRMAMIAIPSICQQSFVSVGVFCVQGLVNPLGSNTVAGFSAALKVSTFAIMVMNALPNALSSFAAQNIGAQDIKRVRQGVRDCIIMSELVIGSIIVLFFVAGQPILQLFLGSSSNGTVISVGIEYLLIVAPFYPLVGIKNCCDSALRGGGAMGPFMITTLADLALRVALAYIMVPMMGFAGVCYAYPLGWVIGTSISIIFYICNVWVPKYMRDAQKAGIHLPKIHRPAVAEPQQHTAAPRARHGHFFHKRAN